MSQTTGTPRSVSSPGSTDEVNPWTTKFDGWTLRTMPVRGPTDRA